MATSDTDLTALRPEPAAIEDLGAVETDGREAIVFVYDPDGALWERLQRLLVRPWRRTVWVRETDDLRAALRHPGPGCVLVDVDGLGPVERLLRERAIAARPDLALIAVSRTGHADAAARGVRIGAVDFLADPLDREALTRSLREAVLLGRRRRRSEGEEDPVGALRRLTPREREILNFVVSGCTSREIGRRLGISTRTVEAHRARMLQKLHASSLAEMIYIAATGLSPAAPRL